MAKTNFTKVEEALTEGLRRMEVEKLNAEAERINQPNDPSAPDTSNKNVQRRQRVQALKLAIKWLIKQDQATIAKIKTTEKEIKRLTETSVEQLNDFDFEIVDSLISRIDMAKKETASRAGKGDEDLIAQQRRKHVTKRFNVNDKWLPLK